MPRAKGRKVTQNLQEQTEEAFSDYIKVTFDQLSEQLKTAGYELIIRRPVSKDLVAFDYGLLFNHGTTDVQVFVDEDLQMVINHLLETNEQVVLKSNWFSPDTIAIQVPRELTGDTESDDSSESIVV